MHDDPPQIACWHAEIIGASARLRAHGDHTRSEPASLVPRRGQVAFWLVRNSGAVLQVNGHQVRTDTLLVLEGGRDYDICVEASAALLGMSLERALFSTAGVDGDILIEHALAKNIVPLEPSSVSLLRHLWLMLSHPLGGSGGLPIPPMPLLAETVANNILLALNLSGGASGPPWPPRDDLAPTREPG